ncbi:MAG: permease [Cenarchaeum symbiont of Oopsacas minuta]|nr:permease [Cenarchaeum symbiont of Oopsacas minuta]
MLDVLWLLPLGFVAGTIGSMVGLGGGIIMVPAMTLAGYSSTLAVSVSLYAIFSNAVASTISYARRGVIVYKTGLLMSSLAIPGTVIGAIASSWVSRSEFHALFGVLMVIVAVYMATKQNIKDNTIVGIASITAASVASFGAGMVSSFFGIGGGIIFVPIMIAVLGMNMLRAAPTSQFTLLFISFAGMISHTALGHTGFTEAALLSAGAFIGGLFGAKLASKIKQKNLQIILAIMVAAAAVRLFIEALPEWF